MDDDLGRKRELRLLDDWWSTEIDAVPKEEERERLWTNWERVWGEVEGFPQRMSTEDTKGEAEYVATIEWRRGMRDSE